jgi:hypothetical protein
MASRASGSGSWRFRREKTDPPASPGPGATPQIIVTSPHQGPDGQLMRHPLPRAARAPPAARKPKDPAAGAPDDAFLNRHATEDAESVHADDDDRLRRNRDVSAGGLHADPQVSEYSASDEDGFASPCKVQMKRDDPYPRFCTCGACRKCFFLGSGGAGADADAAVLEHLQGCTGGGLDVGGTGIARGVRHRPYHCPHQSRTTRRQVPHYALHV